MSKKGSHLFVPHPIQIVDANVFPMKGTNDKATHILSMTKVFREFIFFTVRNAADDVQFYLEEWIGGKLEVVHEQEEWEELCTFARKNGGGITQGA